MPNFRTYSEFAALVQGANTAVIAGHNNPDGDCIGSMIALRALLEAHGIEVTLLTNGNSPMPPSFTWFERYDFTSAAEFTSMPDLFIAVDTATADRLGDSSAVLECAKVSICIDHHPDKQPFAQYNFIDPARSANSLLIWQLIKEYTKNKLGSDPNFDSDSTLGSDPTAIKQFITPAMYEGCYVGTISDTGDLSFPAVTAADIHAVAEMVECGAQPDKIHELLRSDHSLALHKLQGAIYDRMQFVADGKIAYSYITNADYDSKYGERIDRSQPVNVANLALQLPGVKLGLIFREMEDEPNIRVSLRSKSDVNCAALAEQFKGGGHAQASGITIANSSIEHTMAEFVPQAERFLQNMLHSE